MPVLVEKVIDLKPGQEWYSDPFELHPGRTLHMYAVGTVPVYLAAVDTARFDQLSEERRAGPGSSNPWPFQFGEDRRTHDEVTPIRIGGPFRVVARLGVFNNAGRVRLKISEE